MSTCELYDCIQEKTFPEKVAKNKKVFAHPLTLDKARLQD